MLRKHYYPRMVIKKIKSVFLPPPGFFKGKYPMFSFFDINSVTDNSLKRSERNKGSPFLGVKNILIVFKIFYLAHAFKSNIHNLYQPLYIYIYIYYIFSIYKFYIHMYYAYICIFQIYHHHHHHVAPLARISLTLSRHFSLSFITSGRSSGLHPVSSHSCCM